MGNFFDLEVLTSSQDVSLAASGEVFNQEKEQEAQRNRLYTERRRMIEERIEWRRLYGEY